MRYNHPPTPARSGAPMRNDPDTEFQLKLVKFHTRLEEIEEKWGVEPADPRTVKYVVALPDIAFASEIAATTFCAWLNETGQAAESFDLMWSTVQNTEFFHQPH